MIFGLGTDVIQISRIQQSLERYGEHVATRILSNPELSAFRILSPGRQAEFVAGRFAAKEAIAKAVGCGLARLKMSSVDISVGDRGLSVTWLNEMPVGVQKDDQILVSISHSEDTAFAVAIWSRES